MDLKRRRDFLKALVITSSILVLGRLGLNLQSGSHGLTSFSSWYVVQYSNYTPSLSISSYVLTVDGEVQNPLQLTYQDILQMPYQEVQDTIQCVSLPSLLSANVVWRGVPMSYLIEKVNPSSSVIKILAYGADGYVADLPLEKAMKDVLVVYAVDGQNLPVNHGFPVRLAVPGWWGYTYVKWLTRLHFTSRNVLGYWESLGYPDDAKK
ncbi:MULTISPECIES: molybdopterin-dependent oxidoreductase [Metallosphaera]|uniref:Oxidoreductase, molybdopterin binding protein n=3 Tax=Metallosphaera TaxID=41980 RepID=A4YFR9_METS5|nr:MULTISPECIES: molybdopterin-dependent oxidoreductase [Metallosphaera]ABP95271.1 oxidoreductase, molybdopterin binding protein [Metallosphaera sedula DSM 5348]AIM27257.1 oxidoreductase, molybdopterin binding protein [Metallosphaera sedula]AKV75323.1 oxidoreductase [Metallosphaera sedula]AKV77565.1 oxidoreductase [Metallosphaera sedula]AKV79811.1 oxidoreductase [Metallosphaera sedula]